MRLALVRERFVMLLALALGLSLLGRNPALFPTIALNFVVWTLLGLVMAALSLAQSVREYSGIADTRLKTHREKDRGGATSCRRRREDYA